MLKLKIWQCQCLEGKFSIITFVSFFSLVKHRVFFTLWNGEMIGLLVNKSSTFTNVYSRLFSFACESKSCSVCEIRHHSCDLWAVDTTGTGTSNIIILVHFINLSPVQRSNFP